MAEKFKLATVIVRTRRPIELIYRTEMQCHDVLPSHSEVIVDLDSVDLEEGIAEAQTIPNERSYPGVGNPERSFPIQLGVDLTDTSWKLVTLNVKGFFLRDDTEFRKDSPELFGGQVEAYSLCTCYPRVGFRRHRVYGGSHAFAVESAYQDAILVEEFAQDIAESFLEVYVHDLAKLGRSRDSIVSTVDTALRQYEIHRVNEPPVAHNIDDADTEIPF